MNKSKARPTYISRRDFLYLMSIGAGGVFIAGCAPTIAMPTTAPGAVPTAGATAATGAIRRGGSLVAAMPSLDHLDPHLSALNLQYQFSSLFDSLTYLDLDEATNKVTLTGALAESWETSPDAKSIDFKLRQGVKFHDGSDWNAEVAAWNIMRLKNDEKSLSKELFADVSEAKAMDPNTLRVSFSSPNVVFPLIMSEAGSLGRSRMISQAAMEDLGPEGFAQNPSGTGAFKFTSWKKDDRLVVDKFEDYWQMGSDGQALPYLDQLVFRELVDEPTVIAEMRAGTIHYFNSQLPYASAVGLQNDPAFDVYYFKEGPDYFMIGANAKTGPFAESRGLRQAIAYAINRDEVVQALAPGIGAPAYQFVSEGYPGYNAALTYPYDPEKAKALLAEAGYPNGLAIKMLTWNREAWKRRAEVYQQQLANIGITSEISALEGIDWRATTKSNQGYDIALWGEGSRADPDLMSRFMTSAGQGNWMNFALPEVDKLFLEGRAELDPAKRAEIYSDAAKIFFDEAYVIPIYSETSPRTKLKSMHWDKRQYLFHTPITWWLSA
jgi:peptide/nickel transport system substrate-binding protein